MKVPGVFLTRSVLFFGILLEGILVFGFVPLTPVRLAGLSLLAFMWGVVFEVFQDRARQITGLQGGIMVLITGMVSGICVLNSIFLMVLFKGVVVPQVIFLTVICTVSMGILILLAMKVLLGKIEDEKRRLHDVNQRLEQTLAEIDELSGVLPICAWCRKIRNDSGYWMQIEKYFESHSKAQVESSVCQECERKSRGNL